MLCVVHCVMAVVCCMFGVVFADRCLLVVILPRSLDGLLFGCCLVRSDVCVVCWLLVVVWCVLRVVPCLLRFVRCFLLADYCSLCAIR